jgi:AcrR family transcriptional regulator
MGDIKPNDNLKSLDRRSRKTERQLQHGLVTLLKDKSLKEVSVRELADFVDINRSTFYVHYHDIYDMVEKIGKQMVDEFGNALNSNKPEIEKGNFIPTLSEVYTFLKKYGEIFEVLLGRNGDIGFRVNFRETARKKLDEWLNISDQYTNQPQFAYMCSFIIQGSIGLMQTWLEQGMKETPLQMAKMTEKFVMSGMTII